MKVLFSLLVCYALFAFVSCETPNLRMEAISDTNPIFLNETYFSGFLPIGNKGSLFYWLFESRNVPSEDPLVVWLTGGPGCASEIALFNENGPYKINTENNTLRINPYSWNNVANMLYIDQPLGTGFSKAKRLDFDEKEIAKDFYLFLQEFVTAFPQYQGRDFYITGESYAGHYIPAISSHIVREGGLNLHFAGVGIGNGLVSVYHQYPQYATFAYENKLIEEKEYESLKTGFEYCDLLLKSGMPLMALVDCQLQFERIVGLPVPRFNVYDIRLPCSHPPLCYDLSFVDKFLEQKEVEQIIGVTGHPWKECKMLPHLALTLDLVKDYTDDLSFLVQSGLNVLVYNGDKDFICNWRGGETLTNNLDWKGASNFETLNYTTFENYGEYKQYENLVFFRVYDAGHMVPMDQPLSAVAMLHRLLQGW